MMPPYRVCARCVMDTTDPEIVFNEDGVCNHCLRFDAVASESWLPNEAGAQKLQEILARVRANGRGKRYGCLIGLSGGVDSSYLALKAKDWDLRPLVMHVDAGWNTELAVANIEKIVKYCGYDLHTHVVDWEDVRRLQLAYLRSGVANQDVPQDHVFFAALYHFAAQQGIRYILSGGNFATESVFPRSWHGDAMDERNLSAVFRSFGEGRLRAYTTIGFLDYYIRYPFVKGMRVIRPLNFMPYHKQKAIEELEAEVGWRSYSRKHGESLFTKFFQNYYLPSRFGYDKRRPHLSSLILSGQLSRVEALDRLSEPLYDPEELEVDIAFFCKKMQITRNQFDEFMTVPVHHYSDFPNQERLYRVIKVVQRAVRLTVGKKIAVYS